ncbi:hypothetical protein AQJ67_05015 [Streptomyces caeruleatus]|uniref:Uncharacterized protein n=1 Tax=Streptomyces caeruleatus TaxID=661399 RepID=A0A101U7J4_9ACTN|nr:hypothetical protein AQJ67_05015 [Streptomyces caeruleatus]
MEPPPAPPPFNKPDGIGAGVPRDGDEGTFVPRVPGAVGNVALGTEPGLSAACIAGFTFVEVGIGDGLGDGRGEFTGAEANWDGGTDELVGTFSREGVGTAVPTDEPTDEPTGETAGVCGKPGDLTGELLGPVPGRGVVTGAATGPIPPNPGGDTGVGAGVTDGTEGDGTEGTVT